MPWSVHGVCFTRRLVVHALGMKDKVRVKEHKYPTRTDDAVPLISKLTYDLAIHKAMVQAWTVSVSFRSQCQGVCVSTYPTQIWRSVLLRTHLGFFAAQDLRMPQDTAS